MLSFILPLIFNTYAAGGHQAHQHGIAEAKIVQAVNALRIRVEIPGESVLGFEHKPSTKEHEGKIEQVRSEFENSALVVEGGNCERKAYDMDLEFHGEHGEVLIRYEYHCERPLDLTAIQFSFLDKYKEIKELKVAYVSKTKQFQRDLNKKQNQLLIK